MPWWGCLRVIVACECGQLRLLKTCTCKWTDNQSKYAGSTHGKGLVSIYKVTWLSKNDNIGWENEMSKLWSSFE